MSDNNSTNSYAFFESTESEEAEAELRNLSLYFVLFSGMLAVVLVSNKFLKESPRLSSYISEPALTLGIGTGVGCCIWAFLPKFEPYSAESHNTADGTAYYEEDNNVLAHSLLSFSPRVFFMALLPPIIFNSGYQLRRELFYRHIKPIVLFACLGTTICALVTAFLLYGISCLGWFGDDFHPSLLEFLTFGSLIAATDSVSILGIFQQKKVDPHLFYLVFGESALNDAVAMILFSTFSDLLVQGQDFTDATGIAMKVGEFVLRLTEQAILSPLLGMVFAIAAALVFKYADLRQHPSAELTLYMLLMYTPFVLAECFRLSGIVAIFFSGISSRRYIAPNVSADTRKNANVLFQLSANLAETCIFLELGLSVFGVPGSFNWSFIVWAFLGSLLGRALGIYPLALVYNYCLTERSWNTIADDTTTHRHGAQWGKTKVEDEACSTTIQRTLSTSSSTVHTPAKRLDKHIPMPLTHMIWFAGLRGAVAYACVRKFPNVSGHTDAFTAATMSIVLVSIVFMGGTTEYLLRVLDIAVNVDEDEYMNEWRKKRRLKGTLHDMGT
jgi:sodium/hydrogen exchanger 3